MKVFLIFFSLISLASAGPSELLTKALNHQQLEAGEREALVKLVFKKPAILIETLKKEMPADLKKQAQALAKSMEEPPAEDEGINRLGAAVGWLVEFRGDDLSSLPILSKVRRGSPAEKAKLRIGDVMASAEGVKLYTAESRNRFLNLLRIWPKNTPLHVEVRRNSRQPELDERVLRTEKVKLKVTLGEKDFR